MKKVNMETRRLRSRILMYFTKENLDVLTDWANISSSAMVPEDGPLLKELNLFALYRMEYGVSTPTYAQIKAFKETDKAKAVSKLFGHDGMLTIDKYSDQYMDIYTSIFNRAKDTIKEAKRTNKTAFVSFYMRSITPEIEFLGGATNRIGFAIGDYVFKVATDEDGRVDNFTEMSAMHYEQNGAFTEFTTKTYEVNGTGVLLLCERATPFKGNITGSAEVPESFLEHKNEILRKLGSMEDGYLFGDVGFDKRNVNNWGLVSRTVELEEPEDDLDDFYTFADITGRTHERTKTVEVPVIIDYGYVAQLSLSGAACPVCKSIGGVRYDKTGDTKFGPYYNLECGKCGNKFVFTEIRDRLREENADFKAREVYNITKLITGKYTSEADYESVKGRFFTLHEKEIVADVVCSDVVVDEVNEPNAVAEETVDFKYTQEQLDTREHDAMVERLRCKKNGKEFSYYDFYVKWDKENIPELTDREVELLNRQYLEIEMDDHDESVTIWEEYSEEDEFANINKNEEFVSEFKHHVVGDMDVELSPRVISFESLLSGEYMDNLIDILSNYGEIDHKVKYSKVHRKIYFRELFEANRDYFLWDGRRFVETRKEARIKNNEIEIERQNGFNSAKPFVSFYGLDISFEDIIRMELNIPRWYVRPKDRDGIHYHPSITEWRKAVAQGRRFDPRPKLWRDIGHNEFPFETEEDYVIGRRFEEICENFAKYQIEHDMEYVDRTTFKPLTETSYSKKLRETMGLSSKDLYANRYVPTEDDLDLGGDMYDAVRYESEEPIDPTIAFSTKRFTDSEHIENDVDITCDSFDEMLKDMYDEEYEHEAYGNISIENDDPYERTFMHTQSGLFDVDDCIDEDDDEDFTAQELISALLGKLNDAETGDAEEFIEQVEEVVEEVEDVIEEVEEIVEEVEDTDENSVTVYSDSEASQGFNITIGDFIFSDELEGEEVETETKLEKREVGVKTEEVQDSENSDGCSFTFNETGNVDFNLVNMTTENPEQEELIIKEDELLEKGDECEVGEIIAHENVIEEPIAVVESVNEDLTDDDMKILIDMMSEDVSKTRVTRRIDLGYRPTSDAGNINPYDIGVTTKRIIDELNKYRSSDGGRLKVSELFDIANGILGSRKLLDESEVIEMPNGDFIINKIFKLHELDLKDKAEVVMLRLSREDQMYYMENKARPTDENEVEERGEHMVNDTGEMTTSQQALLQAMAGQTFDTGIQLVPVQNEEKVIKVEVVSKGE